MTTTTVGRPVGAASAAPRALAVARAVLVVAFAGGGLMKVAGEASMVQMFADIGLGQWWRYVVGTLELAGAIGLLIPARTGLAALGLTALMVGATVTRAAVVGGVPVIELAFLTAAAAIARTHLSVRS